MEHSITMRVMIPDDVLAPMEGRSPVERFAFTLQRAIVEELDGASVRGFAIERRGTQVYTERGEELEHEIDRVLGKYLTPGPPIATKDHVAVVHDRMDRGDLCSELAEMIRRLAAT